jgi:hypothetical protein
MAIRAYNSPGVTVTETVNPALAPLIANPSLSCLVGPAAGVQSATERIYLTGLTPVQLTLHRSKLRASLVVTEQHHRRSYQSR